MKYQRVSLPAFRVIGIAGSTDDGADFIRRLWDEANARFGEIAAHALTDENGAPRVWGLMSDMAMDFRPWEDGFTRGRYLAGVEASQDAPVPEGWEAWTSPAYEYVTAPQDGPEAFAAALGYLAENGLELVGAAYDRPVPGNGGFIYLPVRKLNV